MASDYFDRVEEAATFLRGRLPAIPAVAVILGSGLGAFAERLDDPVACRIRRFHTGRLQPLLATPAPWCAAPRAARRC